MCAHKKNSVIKQVSNVREEKTAMEIFARQWNMTYEKQEKHYSPGEESHKLFVQSILIVP